MVGNGKFSLPQVRKNFLRIVAEIVAELRRERGMVTWQHRHIIGRVEPVARKAVPNVAPFFVRISTAVGNGGKGRTWFKKSK